MRLLSAVAIVAALVVPASAKKPPPPKPKPPTTEECERWLNQAMDAYVYGRLNEAKELASKVAAICPAPPFEKVRRMVPSPYRPAADAPSEWRASALGACHAKDRMSYLFALSQLANADRAEIEKSCGDGLGGGD